MPTPETFNTDDDNHQNKDDQNVDQGTEFNKEKNADNHDSNTEKGNSPITTDALAALVKRDENAQAHIKTLETEAETRRTEMAGMQEKLDTAANVDELLEKRDTPTINVDELATKTLKSVKDSLEQESLEKTATGNFELVAGALTDKYGTEVDVKVKEACEENDMSWEDMVALSRKNPKLAMKLCNVEAPKAVKPTEQGLNTQGVLDQYQSKDKPKTVNVMTLRNTKEQVADMNRRMEEAEQKSQ